MLFSISESQQLTGIVCWSASLTTVRVSHIQLHMARHAAVGGPSPVVCSLKLFVAGSSLRRVKRPGDDNENMGVISARCHVRKYPARLRNSASSSLCIIINFLTHIYLPYRLVYLQIRKSKYNSICLEVAWKLRDAILPLSHYQYLFDLRSGN